MFQARRNKPHSCAAIMDKAVEHVSDVSYAVLFDYDFLHDLNINVITLSIVQYSNWHKLTFMQ
jgi:hypothetical protein